MLLGPEETPAFGGCFFFGWPIAFAASACGWGLWGVWLLVECCIVDASIFNCFVLSFLCVVV
jgi:hypothetical protein